MRRFWMIALTMALATGVGRAQQPSLPTDTTQPATQQAKEKIIPPKPLNTVEAEFPDVARARGIDGVCLVSLTVDINGRPQDPKIVHCTDPSFEQTSLDAVAKYIFKPATTLEGNPVPAKINVEIYYNYNLYELLNHSTVVRTPISYTFKTPPGTTSSEPDADGVYPLTKQATSPVMTKFSNEGYATGKAGNIGNGACDMVLTINVKGNASDPQAVHCARPELEKPAVQSLLKSHYKPGKVNGNTVPMRAFIHIEYGQFPPKS